MTSQPSQLPSPRVYDTLTELLTAIDNDPMFDELCYTADPGEPEWGAPGFLPWKHTYTDHRMIDWHIVTVAARDNDGPRWCWRSSGPNRQAHSIKVYGGR